MLELEIRQVKVVLGPARDGLKASGDVVAQESDRAAEKRRYTVGSLTATGALSGPPQVGLVVTTYCPPE